MGAKSHTGSNDLSATGRYLCYLCEVALALVLLLCCASLQAVISRVSVLEELLLMAGIRLTHRHCLLAGKALQHAMPLIPSAFQSVQGSADQSMLMLVGVYFATGLHTCCMTPQAQAVVRALHCNFFVYMDLLQVNGPVSPALRPCCMSFGGRGLCVTGLWVLCAVRCWTRCGQSSWRT